MSPEQARGTHGRPALRPVLAGLVILYAATGEPTYPGDTFYDLLTAAAAGPGDDAAGAHRALPRAAAGDPARARCEVDPAKRFQIERRVQRGDRAARLARRRGRARRPAVSALFGEELRAEQDRLAAAFPHVPRPAPLAGAGA